MLTDFKNCTAFLPSDHHPEHAAGSGRGMECRAAPPEQQGSKVAEVRSGKLTANIQHQSTQKRCIRARSVQDFE
ncbi:hypothetical protein [Nocardia gipuzkoensis]